MPESFAATNNQCGYLSNRVEIDLSTKEAAAKTLWNADKQFNGKILFYKQFDGEVARFYAVSEKDRPYFWWRRILSCFYKEVPHYANEEVGVELAKHFGEHGTSIQEKMNTNWFNSKVRFKNAVSSRDFVDAMDSELKDRAIKLKVSMSEIIDNGLHAEEDKRINHFESKRNTIDAILDSLTKSGRTEKTYLYVKEGLDSIEADFNELRGKRPQLSIETRTHNSSSETPNYDDNSPHDVHIPSAPPMPVTNPPPLDHANSSSALSSTYSDYSPEPSVIVSNAQHKQRAAKDINQLIKEFQSRFPSRHPLFYRICALKKYTTSHDDYSLLNELASYEVTLQNPESDQKTVESITGYVNQIQKHLEDPENNPLDHSIGSGPSSETAIPAFNPGADLVYEFPANFTLPSGRTNDSPHLNDSPPPSAPPASADGR